MRAGERRCRSATGCALNITSGTETGAGAGERCSGAGARRAAPTRAQALTLARPMLVPNDPSPPLFCVRRRHGNDGARAVHTTEEKHLERLRHIKELLTGRGIDTSAVRLSCYSGAGFTDGPWNAQARGEVVLVDLRRLYAAE
ncbi:hypothetical protein OH809_13290 [Streptomyces sp. NBC_00873]|uniref:hypothetical protein n=1 Tax=Streptomyces sp. NBC_00873 TaxID=2975852 RepID=UPI003869DAB5|nr:hypothetical protein OH809_13290 [Streptomyces sp. NBC_00873]